MLVKMHAHNNRYVYLLAFMNIGGLNKTGLAALLDNGYLKLRVKKSFNNTLYKTPCKQLKQPFNQLYFLVLFYCFLCSY